MFWDQIRRILIKNKNNEILTLGVALRGGAGPMDLIFVLDFAYGT